MRGWRSALEAVTNGGLVSRMAAWIRLVKVSGVQQPATEWLQRQQQASAQLARVFLDDETLTPTASGFSMTAMASRSFSHLWWRCHHVSFCRCAVLFGSQGRCHLSGSLLQKFVDILLLHVRTSRALDIVKFPFKLHESQEQHHIWSPLTVVWKGQKDTVLFKYHE